MKNNRKRYRRLFAAPARARNISGKRKLGKVPWNLPVLLILIGCATPQKIHYPKHPLANPRHVIEQVRLRSLAIRDLSGFGSFRLQSRGKSQSGKTAVNLKKETSVRLEILNLFLQPIQYFLADEQRLLLYIPSKKTAVLGKPIPKDVHRLIGLRMPVRELIHFLLCDVTDADRFHPESASYENDTGCYRFREERGNGALLSELWVDAGTLGLVRYRSYDKEENVRLQVTWDDFQNIKDIPFATKIVMELPGEKTTVEVNYTDLDINTGIAAEVFSLKIPPETRLIALEP